MTIESLRDLVAKPAFDARRVLEQATQAIDSLHRAIAQLRLAQTEEVSALSLGFVTGERGAGPPPV